MVESNRLLIRTFTEDDYEDAYSYLSNEETMYYISDIYTMEDVTSFIKKYGMSDSPLVYALEEKSSNKVIGHMIFHEAYAEEIYEIGCIIHSNYHGKGYGYESMKALLEYGFNNLKLHKIMAETIEGNDNCIKLLNKLNFTLEGTLRKHNFDHGAWMDEYYYGIFQSEI